MQRRLVDHYGAVAQLFHWGIAILILVQIPLGIYGAGLQTGFDKLVLLARHKSIGVTVFVLVVLRLAWRWSHPPPPLPEGMRPVERLAARASHSLLYLLLLALPLSGWLFSSASGVAVSWFGWFALPDLVTTSKPLAHDLARIHAMLSILLAALLLVHIAAALWHHFVRRDSVLLRMSPFGRKTVNR